MNLFTTTALAGGLLALTACGMSLEHLGDNLAGRAYMDGEPAPGYALVNGEYVPVETLVASEPSALSGITGRPCDSDLAMGVRPEGQGTYCVFVEGDKTVVVHDGTNPPIVKAGFDTRGYAKWNGDKSLCEVWLANHARPGDFAHEVKHCFDGGFHS